MIASKLIRPFTFKVTWYRYNVCVQCMRVFKPDDYYHIWVHSTVGGYIYGLWAMGLVIGNGASDTQAISLTQTSTTTISVAMMEQLYVLCSYSGTIHCSCGNSRGSSVKLVHFAWAEPMWYRLHTFIESTEPSWLNKYIS